MDKKSEKKKKEGTQKRKSKNIIIDKETGIISGQREIRKIGDSFYVNIPREFLERHGLKEGTPLTMAADHILKFIPVAEV